MKSSVQLSVQQDEGEAPLAPWKASICQPSVEVEENQSMPNGRLELQVSNSITYVFVCMLLIIFYYHFNIAIIERIDSYYTIFVKYKYSTTNLCMI